MIWLLAQGRTCPEVAGLTSFAPRWVEQLLARYNADGGAGLTNRRSPGPLPRLTPAQKTSLAARVEAGPDPKADGVVRWRQDLKRWIEAEFGW